MQCIQWFGAGITHQSPCGSLNLIMKRRHSFLALLLVAVSVTPVAGQRRSRTLFTAPSFAGQQAGGFVYVANFTSADISAFSVDTQGGALTGLVGSPFLVGAPPVALAASPSGQFVYAATQANTVVGFALDTATGNLTAVPGSPFPTGSNPSALAFDPSGQFLYVTNMSANTISAYTVDQETGALNAVPGSPFLTGSQPVAVSAEASGQFLYVVNQRSNDIFGYAIASTGGLVPLARSPYSTQGTSPRSVTMDPDGQLMYIANVGSHSVSGFNLGPRGSLIPIDGLPFTVSPGVFTVAVDPSGQMVYTVPGPDTVSSITPLLIKRSGALTPVCGAPFLATQDSGATSVIVHPSTNLVYVTNSNSNTITGYTVNIGTGTLTALPGSAFRTGTTPISAILVPATAAASASRATHNSNSAGLLESLAARPRANGIGSEISGLRCQHTGAP